jgi:glycosyltransferase involved in cell wall biosynthesis
VLNQTYVHWELILVDDGSTDETKNIVQTFLEDNRINYIYKTNGGTASARNIGIRIATGKYLAFIDADDLWDKNKLRSQLDVLLREDVSLVFSQLRCIADDGTPLGKNLGSGTGTYQEFAALLRLVAGNIAIPNSSVIVERQKVNQVGNFKDLKNMEDYDLWIRLLASGSRFYGMSEVLGSFRRHENQKTYDDPGQNLKMVNHLDVLRKDFPGKQAYFNFLIFQRLSSYYKQHNDNHEAKDVCLRIFFSNDHFNSYRFEKFLIDVVDFDNYMRFRRLLIRRFRKFETFLSLIDK